MSRHVRRSAAPRRSSPTALLADGMLVRTQRAEQAMSYLEDAWPGVESSVRGWAPYDPSLRPLHDEDPSKDRRRSLESPLREALLGRWNRLTTTVDATHAEQPAQAER